ncbi:MAG: class I SAM-dependent methyltransferase [Candidatus Sabulitectum sp.]|nr:class I SAM-dependent methyltransferase [Candidatus Sabulitectum sp.]
MKHKPETWESVWKRNRSRNGLLHRAGRKLAAYGDLQRLVLDILKKNCRIDRNTRILEAGCGTGPVAGRLTGLTSLVYGIDISPTATELTKDTGVKTAVADARQLPFRDGTFDLVYSTGVVDLFNDTQAAVILKEIVRVTETGGRIVVITAWSGCRIHETVKKYLIRRRRWRYGPKRTFKTLEHLLPSESRLVGEHAMGALFQFRFLSYLFEEKKLARRLYHLVYLLFSILLWPLNRLPGAVLVTIVEKE